MTSDKTEQKSLAEAVEIRFGLAEETLEFCMGKIYGLVLKLANYDLIRPPPDVLSPFFIVERTLLLLMTRVLNI